MASPTADRKPRIASPVSLKNRSLWLSKLKYQPGRIVISGWTWTGPVEEAIPVSEIETFHRWPPSPTGSKGVPFRLSLEGRPSVMGRMERGIALLARKLERREVDVKRHGSR